MSGTEPDRIRADIERTRAELSNDVDALTDKVSPSRVAERQADKLAHDRAAVLRDPERRAAQVSLDQPGSVLAIVVAALASLGFVLYVANVSSYSATYGALAGVIIAAATAPRHPRQR